MTDRAAALSVPQRAAIVAALGSIRDQLDLAQELLAAVYISHALDCLDPDSPTNRPGTRKLH